jgi:hypothetical protein
MALTQFMKLKKLFVRFLSMNNVFWRGLLGNAFRYTVERKNLTMGEYMIQWTEYYCGVY